MRHSSPSGVPNRSCATCSTSDAPFRCLECSPLSMYCQRCLVAAHQHNVLHHIQVSPAHDNICSVNNFGNSDGPGTSLLQYPFPALVLYTNLVIASANVVPYHRPRPSSPSSISLAFTLSASPTVFVTRLDPPLSVASSSCVYAGSLQRGTGRAPHSPSGS